MRYLILSILLLLFVSCEGLLWDGNVDRALEEDTVTITIDFPEWEHFYHQK